MRRRLLALLATASMLLTASAAQATFIDVHSTSFCCNAGGEGTGRAQGIHADSTFSISSVGIYASLSTTKSFDVVIYSSTTGFDVGLQLASASAVVGGTANGFKDINIAYTFVAGSYYVVNWRPTDAGDIWAITVEYWDDSALPTTVGPLTLVDGLAGYNPSINFLHPRFRYDVVPEPASGALLGLGLAAMAVGVRRQDYSRELLLTTA